MYLSPVLGTSVVPGVKPATSARKASPPLPSHQRSPRNATVGVTNPSHTQPSAARLGLSPGVSFSVPDSTLFMTQFSCIFSTKPLDRAAYSTAHRNIHLFYLVVLQYLEGILRKTNIRMCSLKHLQYHDNAKGWPS